MTRGLRIALRASVYLLLAACSQTALESYGCACASRTYTAEEIAGYRTLAERNEPTALAEMREYYTWRADEHPVNSKEHAGEMAKADGYYQRLLALRHPSAVDEEVGHLLMAAAFDKLPRAARLANLEKAQKLVPFLRGAGLQMADYKDPKRKAIATKDYIARELNALLKG